MTVDLEPLADIRARLLAEQLRPGTATLDPHGGVLDGFGGVHGGVIAAATIAATTPTDRTWRPVSVSVDFLTSLREVADLAITPVRWTRRTGYSTVAVDTAGTGTPAARAAVLWAAPSTAPRPESALPPPPPTDVLPIDQCEIFEIPTEFVPITPLFTIRPAAGHLPFTGSTDARLTAWVTLNGGTTLAEPILTPEYIAAIADSLAPAIAATYTEMLPIPTVRMSMTFNHPRPQETTGSTVLIDARAHHLGGNWVTETINLWLPDGTPLVQATQTRLVKR